MMTWYLWRLFYRTLSQHPLFWYRFASEDKSKAVKHTGVLQTIRRLVFALLIPLIACAWLLFLPIPIFLLSFLLFFAAPYAGALAAFSISRQVIREIETGRYEQLAVTPDGDFGLASAVAMRVLRGQQNLRSLLRLIRAIHMILFFTAFAIGVVNILLFMEGSQEMMLESGLPTLLISVAFVGLLHIDFIQATLLGALVGMFFPTVVRRADSPFLAVCLTVMLQLGLYVVVVLLISLVNLLFSLDADLLWNTEGILLILLTALASIFILHEVMLAGLWRILSDRLNFNPRLLSTTEHHGS
jgi:hypothetical protein